MANTIKTTNRTIEVAVVDADYMMPIKLNVQSVVFIPGTILKGDNYVYIIENNSDSSVKILLTSTITQTEPRAWIFNQRLQLGFIYANGVFDTGAKVIFNIGEIHPGNNAINMEMRLKLCAEVAIP